MKEFNLIIASSNPSKVKELQNVLQSLQMKISISSIADKAITVPNEPYDDFMQNAIHKAKYYAKHTHTATVSEDAGLCIESLDGYPGVKTKDLVDGLGSIDLAFKYLQNKLKDKPNKKAYFICAMALYIPEGDILITHEEKDFGHITFPPRGNEGFGFDPIFIPDHFDKTFAELGNAQKSQISHRAKTMRAVAQKLQKYLKQT